MHTPILHKADASSSAQNTHSKLNNSLTLKAAHCAAFLLCGENVYKSLLTIIALYTL